MSAGFLEELRLVRGFPRDSHLLTLKGTDLVRACPRSVKKCYGGLCVVRGCPRGVKVDESRLSADSRQVFRFSFNNHSTESFFSAATALRGSATFHSCWFKKRVEKTYGEWKCPKFEISMLKLTKQLQPTCTLVMKTSR